MLDFTPISIIFGIGFRNSCCKVQNRTAQMANLCDELAPVAELPYASRFFQEILFENVTMEVRSVEMK